MGFQIQAGKVLLVGSATLSWIRVYTARGWSPGDRLGSIPLKGPTLSAPMVESPACPGAKESLNQSGYVPYNTAGEEVERAETDWREPWVAPVWL